LGKQDREKFIRQKLFSSKGAKSQWYWIWPWPPFSRWFEGFNFYF